VWSAARGITIRRVLTDNAWACTKATLRATCARSGIWPRWTRPWRPQANGKAERFHRTLLEEWAYHRPYASDTTSADATATKPRARNKQQTTCHPRDQPQTNATATRHTPRAHSPATTRHARIPQHPHPTR